MKVDLRLQFKQEESRICVGWSAYPLPAMRPISEAGLICSELSVPLWRSGPRGRDRLLHPKSCRSGTHPPPWLPPAMKTGAAQLANQDWQSWSRQWTSITSTTSIARMPRTRKMRWAPGPDLDRILLPWEVAFWEMLFWNNNSWPSEMCGPLKLPCCSFEWHTAWMCNSQNTAMHRENGKFPLSLTLPQS